MIKVITDWTARIMAIRPVFAASCAKKVKFGTIYCMFCHHFTSIEARHAA